jgi:hypothetical protein
MRYGVLNAPEGVPTCSAPCQYFGRVINPKDRYPMAVMADDACHAHRFGTSLQVNGKWYWRTTQGSLVDLNERPTDTTDNTICRCGRQ